MMNKMNTIKQLLLMMVLTLSLYSCSKDEMCDVTVTNIIGNYDFGILTIRYSDGTEEFNAGDTFIQIGDCKNITKSN